MSAAVIGIGNVLFQDEGIGVFTSKYLETNYTFEPAIDVIDGGTLGFKLMCFFQEYDEIVILDTISIEDDVGSIFCIPGEEMLGMGQYRKTAHEVEVVQMLEICSLLGKMADVTILGIIPEDIETVHIGLTEAMKKSFSSYMGTLLKTLESKGYKATPKAEQKTLDQIIDLWHDERMSRDGE